MICAALCPLRPLGKSAETAPRSNDGARLRAAKHIQESVATLYTVSYRDQQTDDHGHAYRERCWWLWVVVPLVKWG